MDIRYIEPDDMAQIKDIYDKYFSDMEIPDFSLFHCVFVIHENNQIIAVGGLKPLIEAVILTDQSLSVRKRRSALLTLYTALTYSAEKLGFSRLHTFAFEPRYIKHLINRMKFKTINESQLLVLELKDGKEERGASSSANTITKL